MSISKEIRDKYEEEYHTGKIANEFGGFSEEHWLNKDRWFITAKNLSDSLFSWANGPPCVLEIGCGEGPLLSELRKYNYGRGKFVGIDISSYAITHNVNQSILYSRACASELPFKDGVFDFVFAFDVLEHLPYPSIFIPAIKDIVRVLKKEGTLAVTIPLENRDGTKNILENSGVKEHYIVMDNKWWSDELYKQGLLDVTEFKYGEDCFNKNGVLFEKGYPYNMSPLNHYMEFSKI